MNKLVILLVVVSSFGIGKVHSTEVTKYKSLFTLNFIRYIGWPEEAKQGDFVIGVLKNSEMAEQLKSNTVGKNFGYQKIIIKEFKSIEDVTDCQILFVSEYINFTKHSEILSQKLNKNNSLIITEDKGAISNGSMINFVIIDNKLKFEVSAENAEKYGLKFSNNLLAMKNAIK